MSKSNGVSLLNGDNREIVIPSYNQFDIICKESVKEVIKELKGDEEDNQFNIGSMRRRKKRVSTDDFLNQYRKKDDNDDIISKNY